MHTNHLQQIGWRTQTTHDAYMAKIKAGHLDNGCRLCDAPAIETFRYWKLIPNDFPYDHVASVHDMLIPLRHTDGSDITGAEQRDLETLRKTVLNERYNYMLQSLPKAMSIPGHLHYHLIVPREFT